MTVKPGESSWQEFGADVQGEWVRVKSDVKCPAATVHFTFSNADQRPSQPEAIFASLSTITSNDSQLAGLIRARGENKGTLQLAAMKMHGSQISDVGYYELDGDL